MMEFVFSTILLFAGCGVALAVLLTEGVLLFRVKKKASPLFGILVAAVYGGYCIAALVRQGSGTACAMLSGGALALMGILLLIHLWLLWDGVRQLKKLDGEVDNG